MIESAGVVVIDWSGLEPVALCVRAYRNWDFPKGKLEEGESHLQAAIRELAEETSIYIPADAEIVPGIVAPSVTYGKGAKSKTATYFLADRTSNAEPYLPVSEELGRPENDEYRWIAVSRLMNLMPGRLVPVVSYVQDWVGSEKPR